MLLLDEPLSALDAKIRVALRNEIRAIQRQLGITTVYVTHDQEEALSLSDRVVVMSEGRIEQIGTPFEIYNFPATPFVASFVGTLNLVAAGVVDAGAGRLSVDGQEVRTTQGRSPTPRPAVAVTLALRPERHRARRGRAGREPAAAARSRTSASSARSSASGCASATADGATPTVVARHVQRAEPRACPTSARPVTVVVPAGGVLRPWRSARRRRGRRRRGGRRAEV